MFGSGRGDGVWEQIDGEIKRWRKIIGCKASGGIYRHVNNPGEG